MQLRTDNSPFNPEQTELLNRLVPSLGLEQRIWLCGYLTALAAGEPLAATGSPGTLPTTQANPALAQRPASAALALTVLYGSQTGNAQGLASDLVQRLEGSGFQPVLASMQDYRPRDLAKVDYLFVLVSTHGEGDPPDNALPFYEALFGRRAPQLEHLHFAVLALGDTSYEFFCQTGIEFDQRLAELGGQRLLDRVDCDVDYDGPAAAWMDEILNVLASAGAEAGQDGGFAAALTGGGGHGPAVGLAGSTASGQITVNGQAGGAVAAPIYNRNNPFLAEVFTNINLNGRGSQKETRHLELDLAGSGLTFEPGDALGIQPENDPQLVAELMETMAWQADTPVPAGPGQGDVPLAQALARHYEITVLTKPLLEKVAQHFGDTLSTSGPNSSRAGLVQLLEPGQAEDLRAYIKGRDLVDLARDFGLQQLPAAEFVTCLRRLPPRLYSLANSLQAYPDEAHLLIRAVRYDGPTGRHRRGVCSVQCAERVEPGDHLPVYVQSNESFRLPAAGDVPIIMVGPGTGVAPFRAFLQEREETGSGGSAWLFFGDWHFRTEFLYQVEWQRWLRDGVLTEMDVAFSRDQRDKVYVQHRMWEKRQKLFAWLEKGAYFYVCGDNSYMGPAVHATLQKIAADVGGMTPEAAEDYVTGLQRQGRYLRDLY